MRCLYHTSTSPTKDLYVLLGNKEIRNQYCQIIVMLRSYDFSNFAYRGSRFFVASFSTTYDVRVYNEKVTSFDTHEYVIQDFEYNSKTYRAVSIFQEEVYSKSVIGIYGFSSSDVIFVQQ